MPDTGPDSGDGWVHCGCGARHWGRYGAAGLLLADDDDRVVLQHRAPWSHHGDTWGIPGGARNRNETAVQAAVREAGEEAGVVGPVRPHASYLLQHPDWSYTTVVARAPGGMPVRATDRESVHVGWYRVAQVTELPLLAAFAAAWPQLRQMVRTRSVLVVDAANVVGARPDGWWKDRLGATTRLIGHLAAAARAGMPAADLGLPGYLWWPAVVVVTEGQARGVRDVEGVQVLRASGHGDDAIAQAAAQARAGTLPAAAPSGQLPTDAPSRAEDPRTDCAAAPPGAGADIHVTVATADRDLQQRVRAVGAGILGPGRLREILDERPR